jgi:hypothetical protein
MVCIADCMAGSVVEGPVVEADVVARATVGVITVGAAARAVALCGEASGVLLSSLSDCELSWTALVAFTACAAASDGDDPLGACENWFRFEGRFEFFSPERLPLGRTDGNGRAEELAEELAC